MDSRSTVGKVEATQAREGQLSLWQSQSGGTWEEELYMNRSSPAGGRQVPLLGLKPGPQSVHPAWGQRQGLEESSFLAQGIKSYFKPEYRREGSAWRPLRVE